MVDQPLRCAEGYKGFHIPETCNPPMEDPATKVRAEGPESEPAVCYLQAKTVMRTNLVTESDLVHFPTLFHDCSALQDRQGVDRS